MKQAQQIELVQRWCEAHAGLYCLLMRGNRDRHAGDPPPAHGIFPGDEPRRLPCFLQTEELLMLPALGASTDARLRAPTPDAIFYPVWGGKLWWTR